MVALESTIVAHGMPWPDNLATAKAVEAVVRGRGATPATVAIVGGNVKVGLEAEQQPCLGQRCWQQLLLPTLECL